MTAVIVVLAAACGKNPIIRDKSKQNIVPVMKSVSTKAQSDRLQESGMPGRLISERVVSSADGFELIEMVYENNLLPAGNGDYATKGSVVTTENISAFGLKAYAEGQWHDNTLAPGAQGSASNPNGPGLYFSKKVTKSSGKWTIADDPKWINDVPITFWSWNPSSAEPDRTDTHSAKFSYTVKSTVSEQEDLVFAFNNETRKFNDQGEIQDGKDEKMDIYFFHALSAVQFLKDDILDGYRISSIEIQNIDSHTECTVTSTDATPAAGSPNVSFSHTPSIPASFSQSYDADDPSLVEPTDYETNPNRRFKPGDGKTFIMIPQEFGSESTGKDTKLKVTFAFTGTPSATTSPVFNFNGTWEAGKYYVYKIDLAGNIHVDISETCDDTAKSNVKFQNTSNVNEYIRATVLANWYDAEGNIVAPWNKTTDGDITLGSGWSLESDGLYYYTSPVASKDFTGNLFDSFIKPTAVPVTGAHFEMTILVQAVASDGYSSCTAAFSQAS